ncbi:hypothetical protein [Paraburkholderia humisilvae]|uniref:Uncharacterized protein n=1 Tax=Paraburkholderia humisilvae TaxID=627669 RepID=A0A6J5FAJ9_9BURK|nr:hypothetical protein [Paraburkholderia humisilvae]CAB3774841.1 hypothetical protein LMG29542_08223 [Paraburkholderia humisilvae]
MDINNSSFTVDCSGATATTGTSHVRAEAEGQLSTSVGFSQKPESPIVAALPSQPFSAKDIEAAFSPDPGPSASIVALQNRELPKALNPFRVADKARAEVLADMAAGNPPLCIDVARIFQLQKGEVTDFRARNGLPLPLRGKANKVTIAGTARQFGTNRVTLQSYVNEHGVFTNRGERSLYSSYKDYFSDHDLERPIEGTRLHLPDTHQI